MSLIKQINLFKYIITAYIVIRLVSDCGRPAVPDLMPRMNGRISRGHSVQHASSPWHVILRDRREVIVIIKLIYKCNETEDLTN